MNTPTPTPRPLPDLVDHLYAAAEAALAEYQTGPYGDVRLNAARASAKAVTAALAVLDLPARDARIRAEALREAADMLKAFPLGVAMFGRLREIADAIEQSAAPAERPAAASAVPAEGSGHPQPDCGHCGGPALGYATKGNTRLCHPDDGMDCYRLVTVYKHPMPCPGCSAERATEVAPGFGLAEGSGHPHPAECGRGVAGDWCACPVGHVGPCNPTRPLPVRPVLSNDTPEGATDAE